MDYLLRAHHILAGWSVTLPGKICTISNALGAEIQVPAAGDNFGVADGL
jgi:hypothetical protein